MAVMVFDPSAKLTVGVQDHVPSAATVALHTAVPLAVTVTLWPGTPVPLIGERTFVVLDVAPACGEVSAITGTTHASSAVL